MPNLERPPNVSPGHPSAVVADDLAEVLSRAAAGLHRLEGKTVVVAGGAGFLPSYLVDSLVAANDRLLDTPCRVISLDNLLTGVGSRIEHLRDRDDVVLLRHDVTKPILLDEQVDFIVHGASVASPTWYRRYPLETIDVNVSGTRNLLELAREHDVEAFVYLSSSEIYGDPPPECVPTSEDFWGHVSATGPRACYDESKRLAEALCMTYYRLYGTPVKLVRPFNVYGPRLRLDDGRVIPDLISDALSGRRITLYSDGRATRSFCYVTDFVSGLLLLLATDVNGEAYNLGNHQEVTIREVAETLDEVSGAELGVRFESSEDPDYLTDNPNRRCPDLSKIRGTIDWSPAVDLTEGLGRTYRYYLSEDSA